MKKIILTILFLLIIPNLALADGMAFRPPGPYDDRWDYVAETNQQAFINYQDGREKLILSVGFGEEEDQGLVWLFPVPVGPKDIIIDVLDNLPLLHGEELSKKAKLNLIETRRSLYITQLYITPFLFITSQMASVGSEGTLGVPGQKGVQGTEPDVVVYQHLDKEGLITEVITAKTSQGLYNYLINKGLKVEISTVPALNNYIGQDYSFIVSWVKPYIDNNMAQLQKGLLVSFPTTKIYYPLHLTSVYKEIVIPTTIRVLGHVSPQIFSDIKDYTKVEYFTTGEFISGSFSTSRAKQGTISIRGFYEGKFQDINYTKIELNAPSKFLTSDLWIKNKTPLKVRYSAFIANVSTGRAFNIAVLLLVSFISGILAGLIKFPEVRNKKQMIKFGVVGLFNLFWLVGVVLATIFIRTKEISMELNYLFTELKRRGYYWKRRVSLFIFIVLVPLWFLLFAIWSRYEWKIQTDFLRWLLGLIVSLLIPLSLLVFSLIIKKIKKEDKDLFNQLIDNDYSSWTFLPRDSRKIAFVVFFSVIFLIVSWVTVKFIQLSV